MGSRICKVLILWYTIDIEVMLMEVPYLPRIMDDVLQDYLEALGAVLIVGPKWCGKTTTAERAAKSVIKMQDKRRSRQYQMLADVNPYRLLEGEIPHLIDEWQVAPVLWDCIRTEVDDRKCAGQFILTGSAVPNDDGIRHTGTGRIGKLRMYPMSLYESQDSNGKISLSDLFSEIKEIDGITSEIEIERLAYLICRGGWPESIHKSEKSALIIARSYVESLCDFDSSRIDDVKRNPLRMKAVLRSYARNICTMAKKTTILQDVAANDMTMSSKSLADYLNVLHRLYVIEDVPAWYPSIRSKSAIRSSEKINFVDPSLAVAAIGLSPSDLLNDMEAFGFYFESLCIRDLKIYSQKLGGTVSYYHDRYGLEADAVLHLQDGRYALIEIKLGSKQIEEGAMHLSKLKKLIHQHNEGTKGAKIKEPSLLMVLTGGEIAYTRKDGVVVVPIGCLKD